MVAAVSLFILHPSIDYEVYGYNSSRVLLAAHCEPIEVVIVLWCPTVAWLALNSLALGEELGWGREEGMLSFYCVWWMWIRPQSLQRSACILQQEKIGSPRITKMHTTWG